VDFFGFSCHQPNFQATTKGIAVPSRESYNEKWSEYFEGGKDEFVDEHYK